MTVAVVVLFVSDRFKISNVLKEMPEECKNNDNESRCNRRETSEKSVESYVFGSRNALIGSENAAEFLRTVHNQINLVSFDKFSYFSKYFNSESNIHEKTEIEQSNLNNLTKESSCTIAHWNESEALSPRNSILKNKRSTINIILFTFAVECATVFNKYITEMFKYDMMLNRYQFSIQNQICARILIIKPVDEKTTLINLIKSLRFTIKVCPNVFSSDSFNDNFIFLHKTLSHYTMNGSFDEIRQYCSLNMINYDKVFPISIKFSGSSIDEIKKYCVEINIELFKVFCMLRYDRVEIIKKLNKYSALLVVTPDSIVFQANLISDLNLCVTEIIEIYNRYYVISLFEQANTVSLDEFTELFAKFLSGAESKNEQQAFFIKSIENSENSKIIIVSKIEHLKNFVTEYPNLENIICETSFQVDSEVGEFYSGKRYGKINKIIKNTGCEIIVDRKYENDNCGDFQTSQNQELDDNPNSLLQIIQHQHNDTFIFSVPNQTLSNLIIILKMFKAEYPTQMMFYLDNKFHKKIIGVRGQQIQKFMKKYDVYVKFMAEKEAEMYGKNVVCKTPYKNRNNLKRIKKEIMNYLEWTTTSTFDISDTHTDQNSEMLLQTEQSGTTDEKLKIHGEDSDKFATEYLKISEMLKYKLMTENNE